MITLLFLWLRGFQVKRLPLLLLHLALDIIMSGALVTHYLAVDGKMHLRADLKPIAHFTTNQGEIHPLPFEMLLTRFEVTNYEGTQEAKDYTSHLLYLRAHDTIPTAATVHMNHIAQIEGYRFCQSGFDPDLRGSYLLVGYDPWGIGITYTGYALLLLSILLAVATPSMYGYRPNLKFLAVGIAVLVAIAILYNLNEHGKIILPVLRSPLLGIHVIAIMTSYTLFLACMIISIVALTTHREKGLYQTSRRLLYPAVFLLTIGIFVGAVWACISWGNYWSWDPKETWALITMLIYALPLHSLSLGVFRRPRLYHIYMLVAFLSVLVTYYGVNYFMSGMHSYG